MAIVKNRRGLLLSLLTIVLFILMLGELFTYAVIDINFSQISQQSAVLMGAGSFAQTVNTGMQGFLQASLDKAVALYSASGCLGNFTATIKGMISTGNVGPSCTTPTNSLSSATLSKYVGALQNQAVQQQVALTIANPVLNVYQSTPASVAASYSAFVTINSAAGTFSYPLNVKATAQTSLNMLSVPITLTNSQASALPANTQITVSFNSQAYRPYEKANLGNIRFYYNSTALYSWCEANCATTATSNSIFWVKIPVSIGAGNSLAINMYMLPKGVDFDKVFAGEAPQLSPTYAQYDNGANVFVVYNNGLSAFAISQTGTGGSGPSATASAPSPYTYAITGSVAGGVGGANTWTINGETATALPTSYIAQMLVQTTGSSPLTDMLTNFQGVSGQFYVFRFDMRSADFDLIGKYPSGSSITLPVATSSSTSSTGTWYQMTAVDNADSLSLYKSTSFSLSSFGTQEVAPTTGAGFTGGGIGVTTDGAASTGYWTIILVRVYPPSNTMPTAAFGSPSVT